MSTNQRAVSCNYIRRYQFDKSAISLCYLFQQQFVFKKSLHTSHVQWFYGSVNNDGFRDVNPGGMGGGSPPRPQKLK